MRRLILVSSVVLLAGVALAAQAPKPAAPKPAPAKPAAAAPAANRLLNPAALNAQGARAVQGEVRHEQRPVRRRGPSRLGAARRRSLLQPRAGRLLHQRAVLPVDRRLHGAVRHERHARGAEKSGAAAQNLKDDPVKQSNKRGYVTFANAGTRTRGRRSCSSTHGQHRSSTKHGLRAVRPGGRRHGGRRHAVRGLWPPERARSAAHHRRRQCVSGRRNIPKLDYIKTATIEK